MAEHALSKADIEECARKHHLMPLPDFWFGLLNTWTSVFYQLLEFKGDRVIAILVWAILVGTPSLQIYEGHFQEIHRILVENRTFAYLAAFYKTHKSGTSFGQGGAYDKKQADDMETSFAIRYKLQDVYLTDLMIFVRRVFTPLAERTGMALVQRRRRRLVTQRPGRCRDEYVVHDPSHQGAMRHDEGRKEVQSFVEEEDGEIVFLGRVQRESQLGSLDRKEDELLNGMKASIAAEAVYQAHPKTPP